MKTKSYLLVGLLLVASSCSNSGEKKIISVEKKEVLKKPVFVAANRKMTVEVEGMSCVHACGGAIRMALKETGAVDRCSFDFEENRAKNTAFITFDKDKISADKIISIIEKINDNQFTTSNPSTKAIEKESDEASTKTNSSNKISSIYTKNNIQDISEYASDGTSFEFPNLIEIFSSILSF